ncbi:MAG: dolichyl-phosphate-mannose--protein mannosyltransferase [Muribaculaceae bacterium]|nr:dolichyl-phosphate-mannose--protein mannosyltransferase [Muribaculaceae bacterium]
MLRTKTIYFYIFYIIALIPIFVFRDYTPDNELRYLSIIDEALENHTYFAFTNHSIPYADKPPLFFWGMMALKSVSGGHYFLLYSILVVLPAILIARIFDRWTADIIPTDCRIVSQGMLLLSGLFIASTLVLRMDMLMCLFIVLAFYEFWKIKLNPRNNLAKCWFPVFIFLAVFTKGPYGFLIPFVCILIYVLICRNLRLFGRAWGWRCWVILIPLFALWFSMVYLEGGPEYLNNLLFHQTMDRAVNSFHHARPFYYYLISLLYCLIPWTLAIIGLIITGLIRRRFTESLQTFFIVVSVTTLILLSCVSSKIQIYLLPAIPFMIYSAAVSFPRYQKEASVKSGLAVIAVIFLLVLPAYAIAKHSGVLPFEDSVWCWLVAITFTLSGGISLFFIFQKRARRPFNNGSMAIIYGMLAAIFFAGFAVPEFNDYIGYKNLADKIKEVEETTGITSIKCLDVRRPENLDVYLHRKVEIIENEANNNDFKNYGKSPFILVTDKKNCSEIDSREIFTVGKYSVAVIQ